jgi:hypothetical protein
MSTSDGTAAELGENKAGPRKRKAENAAEADDAHIEGALGELGCAHAERHARLAAV